MALTLASTRFVAKPMFNEGQRPRELARTMPPHPLSYMELPYDPEYTLYNSRLTPEKLDTATDDEMYWAVRTNVIFRHTGELPIEISGRDAETLLNKVFTRSVSKVKPGRCSYQFACYHDGGMITDGVLLRLDEKRFWMAQADGDLFSWYKAHAEGLDVKIHDPNVWVSQIQGPRSLDLLAAVLDGPMPILSAILTAPRSPLRARPAGSAAPALPMSWDGKSIFFLIRTSRQSVIILWMLARVLIFCSLAHPFSGQGFGNAFRQSSFNAVSIMTGTGYVSANYSAWGGFASTVLLMTMFIGGCGGAK